MFDHVDMSYKKGYRMLTLSWSDGNTLIPINSCLVASSKESNVIGPGQILRQANNRRSEKKTGSNKGSGGDADTD